MFVTNEENVDNRTKAQILLDKLKKAEQKIKLHKKIIGKNTIVYCKNKERLSEYEDSYNNIKNW
jgi:hypothetical protein